MKKLRLSLFIALAFITQARAADQMTLAPGFVYEDIYKGNGMISLDFDPTGAMFVTEKQGRVLLFEPKGRDFTDPKVVLDITTLVNPSNESGLVGLTIDPQFNTNHYVYLFYTTSTDQQLARYTLNADRTALTDPLVLLKGLPRTHDEHKSGDIHFYPGDPDSIYVTAGNDTTPDSAVDDLNAYNGKVLRVNKADGRGFADNPFSDKNQDLDSVKSRTWAYGLRNPFRFTFAPSGQPANALFIAENGDQTDRFFQIEKGGQGGWGQGRDAGEDHPKHHKAHILGLHRPSMTGIAIAEKGPFAGPNGEPVLYVEHWYAPEEIIRGILGTPQGGQQYSTFTPLPGDTTKVPDEKAGAVGGPYGCFAVHFKCVNLKFGPDGNLYMNNASWGPAKGNGFRLGRIKYVGTAAPANSGTDAAPSTGANK